MTESVTPVDNGTDVNPPEKAAATPVSETEQTEPVAEVPTGVEVVPEVDPVEVDADADPDLDGEGDDEDGDGDGDDDPAVDPDGFSGDGRDDEDDE